jgi:hypothetical protein
MIPAVHSQAGFGISDGPGSGTTGRTKAYCFKRPLGCVLSFTSSESSDTQDMKKKTHFLVWANSNLHLERKRPSFTEEIAFQSI